MKVPLYARSFEDRGSSKTKLEIWHDKEMTITNAPFKPYFYSRRALPLTVVEMEMERLRFISDLHDEILYKYSFDSVKDIPLYRQEDSLEVDIPFLQRVAIDNEDFYLQFPQKKDLDILYFDIETDTVGLFPKPKRNIIISISFTLNNTEVITYSINDIKEGDSDILEMFLSDIKKLDPDVLVGYNMLGFDLPYIIDRLRINGLSDNALSRGGGGASFVNQMGQTILNIRGRALFDVLQEVWKDQTLYGISGHGLKEVAKWFNVEQRIRQNPKYKDYQIILEYLGNMRSLIGTERLKYYIESDVLITRELSNFYFKNILTFSEMLKVPLNIMTNRTANLIGTVIYARELRKQRIISDNSNFKRYPGIFGAIKFDERRQRDTFQGGTGIQGALVGLFKDGRTLPLYSELKAQYDDVWKIDFAGMYPSIQRTFNLSPETTKIVSIGKRGPFEVTYEVNKDFAILGVPDRKIGFVKIKILKSEGFLPKMLTEMHYARQEIKKKLNSIVTPKYEREALESLSWTLKVQQNMNYGINGSGYFRYGDVAVTIATTGLGRYFMNLILSLHPKLNISCDTDGLYLMGRPNISEYNKLLDDCIHSQFGLKSYLELDVEGPFPKGYFLKRKNYLLMRPDGTIIKHGNSFKGTSKNILFAYALEKLIKAMFNESGDIESVIRECFKLDERDIKDFIQKTRVNRPIVDYESGGCLQVQVAKQLAQFHDIEVEQGDSIEYVKQEEGYVIKDLANIRHIDKAYYIRQVESVLRRLNLTKYTTHSVKCFKGRNRFSRGRAGYMYESNGKISKQMTLL